MDRVRSRLLAEITLSFKGHKICGLLGPRQSGKTTLAKMYAESFYPNNAFFFDLENPADLSRLENPLLAFSQVPQKLIVIDEIQRLPSLFPILRVAVDDIKNNHIFLILGSASPDLTRQSSESLAGRIAYVEVMPFSVEETQESQKLWLVGGFPRSYLAEDLEESIRWRKQYIKTFLEQDIPNLGFRVPPEQLRRFWSILAHYHGQILNLSELGRALNVSHNAIKNYVDILASTFMIRILVPWFENINKRQIKSPKIYFRDSGLLHELLNITTEVSLYNNSKVGASWEGFALEETIRYSHVDGGNCYFWSTQSYAELDLLMNYRSRRIGLEFKFGDNPKITKSMVIALQDLQLDHLYIINPGNASYSLHEKITVCGLDSIGKVIFSEEI